MSAHGFSAPSGGSGLYAGLLASSGQSTSGSTQASDQGTEVGTNVDKEAQPIEKPKGARGRRSSRAALRMRKAWSAALGFAPVVRKRAPAPKAAPSALSTTYNVATIVSAPKLTIPTEDLDGAALTAEPLPAAPPPRPPPMTLAETSTSEDVNGFRQTAAGKRAANADRKKRKKKRRNDEDPVRDYSADYDPAKPNDYAEWKTFCKWRKAEEREAKRREEEEDYSSGSEEDTRVGNRGNFFAPPTAFYAAPSDAEAHGAKALPDPSAADSPPYQPLSPAHPPSPPRSPPLQPQSGEDAYARRMAMSAAQTGDEAYARRAALSTAPPTADAALLNRAASLDQLPVAQSSLVNAEEAAARARAIAERLGKLAAVGPPLPAQPPTPTQSAPPPPAVPPSVPAAPVQEEARPNPHAFAAKLMAKYGWKKGQGLGASEDGMLNPLAVAQSGKKQEANEGKQPLGFSTAGRGTIISDQKKAKDQSEKERFGEPSRIVLLRNVVGRNDVDEDLAGEIGEEAGKHGYVERCKIHIMPFNVADEQAVRIFVCFSGLVGAWKAVKELDGRLFGGRTIRATFFDEDFFDRGAYGIGD